MNQDMHQKVKTTHLKRNAYLYIRQSTLRQVFENSESDFESALGGGQCFRQFPFSSVSARQTTQVIWNLGTLSVGFLHRF